MRLIQAVRLSKKAVTPTNSPLSGGELSSAIQWLKALLPGGCASQGAQLKGDIFRQALSPVLVAFALLSLSACQRSEQASSTVETATEKAAASTIPLQLGSLSSCQHYSGLPTNWLKAKTAGMAYIPAGQFRLGSTQGYRDELPLSSGQQTGINAFWIDQTEVTNAQFASFVKVTGYVTDAEKQRGAAVFIAPKTGEAIHNNSWWHYVKGASWQHPAGPNSNIQGKEHEPVILLTRNDAEHYAVWLGRDLPTEAQWEYAAKAQAGDNKQQGHAPHDAHGTPAANYWQGDFPLRNDQTDHFAGLAPVGCYAPNAFGLYDMIGNVWEWTQTPYSSSHDDSTDASHQNHGGDASSVFRQSHSHGVQPNIDGAIGVIKGGSYLCAANYCVRYRAAARFPQEVDLATNHVGFRTVLNINTD